MRVAKVAPRLRQPLRGRLLPWHASSSTSRTGQSTRPAPALGFLVGRAAAEQGHEVSLFLAGDAVQLLREPVLDALVGLGTGSLRESYDALRDGGARFYVSGMSAKARGLDPGDAAEAVMPARLVELALEADRVLTY